MKEELKSIKTDEFTIKSGHLKIGNGHKVWFEQWGNSKAKNPILVFHGGPGSHFKQHHKYIFDPKMHQVIGFDQRGCGNSLPYGEIKHNTTKDLLNDAMEILKHLKIKKIHIFGGSWGSTLALLFATEYPELVESIVIRGVFLATQKEINWIDRGDFKNHYPEVWEQFANSVPAKHIESPADYHYNMLASSNEQDKIIQSAKSLEDLEVPLMLFDWPGYPPNIKTDEQTEKSDYDPVPYKIYAHYLSNACFLEDNYILKNANKITAPLYIVQGRYDMVCPPINAYRLHKTVSSSKLFMTLASHGNDPETRTAMKSLIATIY